MEIVLWCEDVDAAYAQALAAGATVMREPHDFQEGRLRVARWTRSATRSSSCRT